MEYAREADLLICEGMYGEAEKAAKAKEYKHMTFQEAARMAKEAQARELWLTHYSPSLIHPRNIWKKCGGYSPMPARGMTEKAVSCS